jgi:hypothetical protein
MAYFIVGAICFGIGLGIGRIKNAAKLKAISDIVIRYAGAASAEARTLATDIRAHL